MESFAPYCVRKCTTKKNNGRYDLSAGPGMFIVGQIISTENMNRKENHMMENSWFQIICEEIMNKQPILSPAEVFRLSDKYEIKRTRC